MDGNEKLKKSMRKYIPERGILVTLHLLLSYNTQWWADRKASNKRRNEEACVSETPEVTPAGQNHIFKGNDVQQSLLKDPQQSINTLGKGSLVY